MATTDPRVDAYIEKSQPFARPILKYIRKSVHAGCPGVQETVKWGMPHFDYKGPLCGMAAFKEHCALGFWKATLLGMDTGKTTEAMGQFGCVKSIADLPSAPKLIALVKLAAKLNDEGVKAPRASKAPKGRVRVPTDFAAALALKKNRKAQAAFEGFSPSHRREYIEWITEAKQQTTRERRMATAIEWLSEGKSRNWQYP
jgi:uncharacterized protein YdeI (YjbR/CyaY-like superfamily)